MNQADLNSAASEVDVPRVAVKARIIIPVWGAKYVAHLDSACLPALLAPGNLPYLADHFECELVIVTESHLFDVVRSLDSVQKAQRWCSLRLTAMDDVLSHPSYYGYTITQALYRGFTDLGEAAKDVWCLFLNADFILADGSYRGLVARMQAGERCILSPSYCTIEEDVRPLLIERARLEGGVLAVPPREMAGLILDNRHFTIRAKTINWTMYKIDHVDQFYYVLDRDTLLGRQIPVAVVAFRPERVPKEPVAFWDYGVLTEICPTAPLCVLGDSDDFLMLELRGMRVMGDWLRLGRMDKDEIARDLSMWSTADQRRCGQHTLVLHRADLPANLAQGANALDEYYRDVESRLATDARDHQDHYIWTQQVQLHGQWLAERAKPKEHAAAAVRGDAFEEPRLPGHLLNLILALPRALFSRSAGAAYRALYDVLRVGYRALYGRAPEVRALNPQQLDLQPVVKHIRKHASGASRALVVCSMPGGVVAPHLSLWFKQVETAAAEDILGKQSFDILKSRGPYDLCFLELRRDELLKFRDLYRRLRVVVRTGGQIVVLYRTRGQESLHEQDLALIYGGMPDLDLPELEFRGGVIAYLIQRVWETGQAGVGAGSIAKLAQFTTLALLLGPLAAFANWRSTRRDPGRFVRPCTSLFLKVTVL